MPLSRRREIILIILIIAIATALRFYKLGEWSFWIDEMFTLRDAEVRRKSQLTFALTRYSLENFGRSEFTIRLPSTLIGIFSLPFLYLPIRKLFSPFVALLTLSLLSVSQWHIFWSQNARFYVSILLFYNLALYSFYIATEKEKTKWLYILATVCFLSIAVWDRVLALMFLPVGGIYWLGMVYLTKRKFPTRLFATLIALGILGIITTLILQPRTFQVLLERFVGHPTINPIRLTLEIIFWLGIPLFFAALTASSYLLYRYFSNRWFEPKEWMLLVSAWLPLAMLVAISPFFSTFPRYIFFTLPSFCLLIATVLQDIAIKVKPMGLAVALAGLCVLLGSALTQDLLYFQYNKGARPNWRPALWTVYESAEESDVLLTTKPEIAHYYVPNANIELIDNALHPFTAETDRPALWLIEAPIRLPAVWRDWASDNCKITWIDDVNSTGRVYIMRIHYCP